MEILKRENWWIWLLLTLFSGGSSTIVLGALLGVFDKNAWYAKWYYWVIGLALFIFPFFVMVLVFIIQILCQTCAKLKVSGKEIYLSPYLWLIAFIVPILGWFAIIVTLIYLNIASLMALYNGNAEQYM